MNETVGASNLAGISFREFCRFWLSLQIFCHKNFKEFWNLIGKEHDYTILNHCINLLLLLWVCTHMQKNRLLPQQVFGFQGFKNPAIRLVESISSRPSRIWSKFNLKTKSFQPSWICTYTQKIYFVPQTSFEKSRLSPAVWLV